jgi:hypothetical protein
MIIAITLLLGSMCLAMFSGSKMMKAVSTSQQTTQDGGTGASD